MKKSKQRGNQKGFTLIETIIALVLVSIMVAMLLTFYQPLHSSLGAFSWFNDELLLQQSMERILGDYKRQRNASSNPDNFDPGAFRDDVKNNYPLYDNTRSGFLAFTCAGTTPNIICTAGSPQATIPAGTQWVLIITVQRNGMILSMIFT
jgi:prepilin-type N-terminal cleavage/methylation domain-containing protein